MKSCQQPVYDIAQMGSWSKRTLNALQRALGGITVYRLYLFHVTTHGDGIKHLRGIGAVSYQEIRKKLMLYGYPDLEEGVFQLGFDGGPAVTSAIITMIYGWKYASTKRRERLKQQLARRRYVD